MLLRKKNVQLRLHAHDIKDIYKIKAIPYYVDVANFESIKKLKLKINEDLGPVSILINNGKMLIKLSKSTFNHILR